MEDRRAALIAGGFLCPGPRIQNVDFLIMTGDCQILVVRRESNVRNPFISSGELYNLLQLPVGSRVYPECSLAEADCTDFTILRNRQASALSGERGLLGGWVKREGLSFFVDKELHTLDLLPLS